MEAFIMHWGYLAILAGVALEGEAVLVAAGAMAHQGLLSLPWVVAIGFMATLGGDQTWFLLGRRFGSPFLNARPKLRERAGVVQTWLERYDTLFLLGFRFLYGLRTVTPLFLGANQFPARRFAAFNAIGAAVWSVSFATIGYGLGASFKAMLERHGRVHELLLVGVAVAALLAAVVLARIRRRERLGTIRTSRAADHVGG